MGKFYLNNLPKEERIKLIAEFYDSLSSLRNRDEVRFFLKDLLSPDEIAMLVRRIQVALLLLVGVTYREIEEKLKVGKQKIVNVHKSLERDGRGYLLVVKRLLKTRKRRKNREFQRETREATEWNKLKNRYPGYFLTFHLVDAIGNLFEETEEDSLLDRIEERKRKGWK